MKRKIRNSFLLAAVFLSVLSVRVHADELSLFDNKGTAVAYVADDLTIYLWNGDAVSYLSGADNRFSIYAFNGTHLGYMTHGVVFDHHGYVVGFTKQANSGLTLVEPGKGVKGELPAKMVKEFTPVEPMFTNQMSNLDLETLLRGEVRE